MQLPKNYKQVYSAWDICQAVGSVGKSISGWAREVAEQNNSPVIAICVLKGGVFFFSDLIRVIDAPLELGFMGAKSYSGAHRKSKPSLVESEELIFVENRSIILVDDICDTGETLETISHAFRDRGAKEVRSAVLLHRDLPTESAAHKPTYAAITHK